ncbi:MAG: hypothetical protein HY887_05770 [Deltaproteobacteria bacterium]|nr:hypothetical protein [Deltaproteobacteria bacterium]
MGIKNARHGSRMHLLLIVPLFLLRLFPFIASADELTELKDRVDRQERLIEGLKGNIEQYKAGPPPADKSLYSANLTVFGDINFSTKARDARHSGFSFGEFDFYSSFDYGDKLNFLSEMVIEADDNAFELDFERLLISYSFSDLLKLSAGKYHTSLGYWNEAFHHGKQLYAGVDRPFFLAFEHDRGVVPVHMTGIELGGGIRTSHARYEYELDISNGARIDRIGGVLEPNIDADDNDSKEVTLKLVVEPAALLGLEAGISVASFKLDTSAKPGLNQRIYAVHMVYDNDEGAEAMAEYFRFDNAEASADAFYVQFAYNAAKDITPYLRYESLDIDYADPYFKDLKGGMDRRQSIAGVRYDIVDRSAIKAQVRRDSSRHGNTFNVFEVQWAFNF